MMFKKGMKRLVVSHYFLVVLLTLVLVESVFIYSVRVYYYNTIANQLSNHAQVSASFYNKFHTNLNALLLDSQLADITDSFASSNAELQVINAQGVVLASSSGFAIRAKSLTEDVKAAARGATKRWIGANPGTGERIMAVSTPLQWNGQSIAVLRYMTSLEAVDGVIRIISGIALLIGLLILATVTLVSLALANSIVKPIKQVTAASSLMAQGQFDTRVDENYKYELGELARTLNYMAKEIVKSDNLKNDFISSISHELRTPLTSIKGWSETILSGDLKDTEGTKKGLKIISKETDRLVGLVEELLDFAKLEQKQLALDVRPTNIAELLNEVMLQLSGKAADKRIAFRLQAASGTDVHPLIPGDENRLKQVFLNIMDNAVKFAYPDTTIKVGLSLEPDCCVVRVRDQGIGIADVHLQHVTNKFYQVRPGGGGTGLGLAICKEIIDLHHGTLSLTSTASPQGTEATVRLPLA
ncbi:HAMP domain-containing sensor histidine kinase [Paenibacillus piri]|uniref:histidine kinase n=1 Tax=Paenibacillus piri TaxID=2547395 RepID=A0A4R5KKC3_9BACL|nr:ATP-binding protein [Paenibacillus piri]TDF95906.1 HAMP domain-containing histidine kinase [Paenibacillus piri]